MMNNIKNKLKKITKTRTLIAITATVLLITGVLIGTTLALESQDAKNETAGTIETETIIANAPNEQNTYEPASKAPFQMNEERLAQLMSMFGITQKDLESLGLPFDITDISKFFEMSDEERAAFLNNDFSEFLERFAADSDVLGSFDFSKLEEMELPIDLPDFSAYKGMTRAQLIEALKTDIASIIANLPFDLPEAAALEGMTREEKIAAIKEWMETQPDDLPFDLPDLEAFENQSRDEIIAAMKEKMESFLKELPFDLPDFSSYEGMEWEEATEAIKADMEPILAYLLEEGLISQENADDLLNSGAPVDISIELPFITEYLEMNQDELLEALESDMVSILDSLISDGMITQNIIDMISGFFND